MMGVDRLLNKYGRPGSDPAVKRERERDPGNHGISQDARRGVGKADSVVDNTGAVSGVGPVEIRVDASARVSLDVLPEAAAADLRRAASFINPAWRRGLRYHSLQPPEKYLYAYYVDDANRICFPRAGLRWLIDFFQARKIPVYLDDHTISVPMSRVVLFGKDMEPVVSEAFRALWKKRYNILGATGDSGFLITCALIAARGEKTLIVVKHKYQLYQWRDALLRYTDLDVEDVGLVGDQHRQSAAAVVVGIDRSLYKCLDDIQVGHLVVDRCDTANVKIFYQICWAMATRYITGLAERVEREDGLTQMMALFCGPIRYQVPEVKNHDTPPVLQVFHTETAYSGEDYDSLLQQLCEDELRNKQITADVLSVVANSTRVLVVSVRTRHLTDISAHLSEQFRDAEIVTGRTKDGAKKRAEARFESGDICVLMTTTKTAAALEISPVDAVFVITPFKYKDTAATLVRHVKSGGQVFEYSDAHPFFKTSLRKRISTYKTLGVVPAEPVK